MNYRQEYYSFIIDRLFLKRHYEKYLKFVIVCRRNDPGINKNK